MKGIILIVEDLPEEQEKAKKALTEAGFKTAVAATLDDYLRIWKNLSNKVSGIITDIHFPEQIRETAIHPSLADPSKPCGVAVVAEAVGKGVPVVVCSDINHHFADYLRTTIRSLKECHPLKEIPFIMDSKDWNRAVQKLQELIDRKGENKMKLLIVTDNKPVGWSLKRTAQNLWKFSEIKIIDFDDALVTFLSEEPTHVIIDGYFDWDKTLPEFRKRNLAYRDIKASADRSVRIVRLGIEEYDYPDYVKVPSSLLELTQALGLNT